MHTSRMSPNSQKPESSRAGRATPAATILAQTAFFAALLAAFLLGMVSIEPERQGAKSGAAAQARRQSPSALSSPDGSAALREFPSRADAERHGARPSSGATMRGVLKDLPVQ